MIRITEHNLHTNMSLTKLNNFQVGINMDNRMCECKIYEPIGTP